MKDVKLAKWWKSKSAKAAFARAEREKKRKLRALQKRFPRKKISPNSEKPESASRYSKGETPSAVVTAKAENQQKTPAPTGSGAGVGSPKNIMGTLLSMAARQMK